MKKIIFPLFLAPLAAFAGPVEIVRTGYGYMNSREFLAFLDGKTGLPEFSGMSAALIVLVTLLGGLALNLTPCVLPMIPINLSIIGADAGKEKRMRSVIRACVYAGGIALAYGVIGGAAVIGGASFGSLASLWYFNLGAAVVFVLLGLSMFDFFQIDFTRFESKIGMPSTAKLAGVFLLGALTAVLAGACVAPVVIAVMLQSANMYAAGNSFGLFLPFVLGIGMGLPWPVLAAGIASLPKPGKWMKSVKYVFGVLIIMIGMYYGFQSWKIAFAKPGAGPEKTSGTSIGEALAESGKTGKPVLIDFYAEWCKNCVVMEHSTFQDPEVKRKLRDFLFVRFDATDYENGNVRKVLDEYKIKGLPAFVVARPDGGEKEE